VGHPFVASLALMMEVANSYQDHPEYLDAVIHNWSFLHPLPKKEIGQNS
jgi:hypothetical protein